MTFEQFWAGIGQLIVSGGIGVTIGGFVFKILSEKWLDNQFNIRLEKFKTEQEKELAEYRAKTASLFSRYSKIHEKEFEVLPIAWEKLQHCMGCLNLIVQFFAEYPDVVRTEEKKLQGLLPGYGFSEDEIIQVFQAPPEKKQQVFQDILFWKNMNKTNEAVKDFNNYLLYNKIFFDKDLFTEFSCFQRKINSILSGYDIGKKDDPKMMRTASKEARQLLEEGTEKIELLVQKRLHFQDSVY